MSSHYEVERVVVCIFLNSPAADCCVSGSTVVTNRPRMMLMSTARSTVRCEVEICHSLVFQESVVGARAVVVVVAAAAVDGAAENSPWSDLKGWIWKAIRRDPATETISAGARARVAC